MSTTAAITAEQARTVLGDAIITEAPTLTSRSCTKPRCTVCDRPARLGRTGACRRCSR